MAGNWYILTNIPGRNTRISYSKLELMSHLVRIWENGKYQLVRVRKTAACLAINKVCAEGDTIGTLSADGKSAEVNRQEMMIGLN